MISGIDLLLLGLAGLAAGLVNALAGGGTLITFQHTALGLIPDGYREGTLQGWTHLHEAVRKRAEKA